MWTKGKPEWEGFYFCCFLDPFGSNDKLYHDVAVTAEGRVLWLGEEITTVYGWIDYDPMPEEWGC